MCAIAAVHPTAQGSGIGNALASNLETLLNSRGQRILIADTSNTIDCARTRACHRNTCYAEEARIRDFRAEGDAKITFWKSPP